MRRQEVTVRLLDGTPYTDKTDWFRLGAAIWMTLFAGGILSAGVLMVAANQLATGQGRSLKP